MFSCEETRIILHLSRSYDYWTSDDQLSSGQKGHNEVLSLVNMITIKPLILRDLILE